MKQTIILLFLLLTVNSYCQKIDFEIVPQTLLTQSGFTASAEIGGNFLSLRAEALLQYSDQGILENIVPSSSIDIGLRYYMNNYFGMDNFYYGVYIGYYFQDLNSELPLNAGIDIGYKYVMRNRITLSTTAGLNMSGLIYERAGLADRVKLNFGVGYRLVGNLSKGTKAAYAEDDRYAGSRNSSKKSKKKSSKKKSSKKKSNKKKKKKRRRN